jgi:transaldolase / glucose-6-phosphate isomerase
MNPLKQLQNYGQSVWLDYIRRSLLSSGELKDLIEQDGIRGVTSNPSIFQKAIAGSSDYDSALEALEKEQDLDAMSLYEKVAVEDIQAAADILKSVYEETDRKDGYVSLEVSPYLAHNTDETLAEARRLWKAVNRPNLLIKVPATQECIPAIQQLISEGINVNVTLLFSQKVYQQVADAYITGLESYGANGGDVSKVKSVASFFVSRIDSAVDNRLEDKIKQAQGKEIEKLQSLLGKTAICNAKLAYQYYRKLYKNNPRWKALAVGGATPQRLLWASTSTKNPAYGEVRYVEELIGEDTVNTIPPAVLAIYRDRGEHSDSLITDVEYAKNTLEQLEQVGISLEEVTDELLRKGVKQFAEAFDKLLSAVENKRETILGKGVNRFSYSLPQKLETEVEKTIADWQDTGKIRQLWAMDADLWTGSDENEWLSWLGITEDQLAHLDRLQSLSQEIKDLEFDHAVLLGMGGSSLCPEVMRLTFGKIEGYPELHILDSTDPAQIKDLESKIDITRTLFIVSSKSGNTLEPNIFKEYFFDRLQQKLGAESAGNRVLMPSLMGETTPVPTMGRSSRASGETPEDATLETPATDWLPKTAQHRFIAVTDPGSHLQKVAEGDNFRHIFYGIPSIGGRYSAISNFGMVPAAVMGVDVAKFLDEAEVMVHSCAASVPASENPGLILGTIMGVLANKGRNKVTLIASPGIADLGAWLEQLLAESTGKEGKGLIPVADEPLGKPEVYNKDRLFVYIRHSDSVDPQQDKAIEALGESGQPIVRIEIDDVYQLGQEFFRWEIATAVAGSIIGINAFNQPDVEASKEVTRQLTAEFEKTGKLPTEKPFFEENGIKLFTNPQNAEALQEAVGDDTSLTDYLRAHLNRLTPGDYLALLAYIQRNEAHGEQLQTMRTEIRDRKQVATCVGFGPRFLHSTGQAYKGGPNTGVFVQITCDDAQDIPIPGHKYGFSVVKTTQAQGDFQVLAQRDRRALRIHLSEDLSAGLDELQVAVAEALK